MRTKTIPVKCKGVVVLVTVDAEDYPRLARHKWHLSSRHGGRACRWAPGKAHRIWMHHEVLGLPPGNHCIDHIDRNRLNNSKSNLRPATTALNAQNQGSRGGSSKHRGVNWCNTRKKWFAQVQLRGKKRNLGRFDSEEEAGTAAAAFRAKHMPFSEEAQRAEAMVA